MNYLGLDYGENHIGIALATGPLAEPLTTIPTNQLTQKLPELIKTHHIQGLVVGKYHASIHATFSQFGLPVYFQDETLSSHDARQSLLHKSQTGRKLGEHAAAAAIILQSWLDSQPHPNPSPQQRRGERKG